MHDIDILCSHDIFDADILIKRRKRIENIHAIMTASIKAGFPYSPFILSASLKGPFITSPWASTRDNDLEEETKVTILDDIQKNEQTFLNASASVPWSRMEEECTLHDSTFSPGLEGKTISADNFSCDLVLDKISIPLQDQEVPINQVKKLDGSEMLSSSLPLQEAEI